MYVYEVVKKSKSKDTLVGILTLAENLLTIHSNSKLLRDVFRAAVPTKDGMAIYPSRGYFLDQLQKIVERPFFLRVISKRQYNSRKLLEWEEIPLSFKILYAQGTGNAA